MNAEKSELKIEKLKEKKTENFGKPESFDKSHF